MCTMSRSHTPRIILFGLLLVDATKQGLLAPSQTNRQVKQRVPFLRHAPCPSLAPYPPACLCGPRCFIEHITRSHCPTRNDGLRVLFSPSRTRLSPLYPTDDPNSRTTTEKSVSVTLLIGKKNPKYLSASPSQHEHLRPASAPSPSPDAAPTMPAGR